MLSGLFIGSIQFADTEFPDGLIASFTCKLDAFQIAKPVVLFVTMETCIDVVFVKLTITL